MRAGCCTSSRAVDGRPEDPLHSCFIWLKNVQKPVSALLISATSFEQISCPRTRAFVAVHTTYSETIVIGLISLRR